MTKVEYREVKIPVKCHADVQSRPQYGGDAVHGVVDLLEYVERLEAVIQTCVEPKKE